MIECTIFGGIILDQYLELKAYPVRGQDEFILGEFSMAGGCSVNMAATFNNLGGTAHMVSCLGPDAAGREILAYLDAHGFSKRYIDCGDEASGYCLVLLEQDGERTFLTKKGVESRFPGELLRGEEGKITYALVTGYYLLSEHAGDIVNCVEKIAEKGGLVLFDPGPLADRIDQKILKRAVSASRIVAMNEAEAKQIGGIEDPSKLIVIKRGAAGGTVTRGQETFGYQAKRVKAVDTTGAGDSFAAGLMFGLAKGMDLRAAVDLGVECAAITVTLKGPHGFWRLEQKPAPGI